MPHLWKTEEALNTRRTILWTEVSANIRPKFALWAQTTITIACCFRRTVLFHRTYLKNGTDRSKWSQNALGMGNDDLLRWIFFSTCEKSTCAKKLRSVRGVVAAVMLFGTLQLHVATIVAVIRNPERAHPFSSDSPVGEEISQVIDEDVASESSIVIDDELQQRRWQRQHNGRQLSLTEPSRRI